MENIEIEDNDDGIDTNCFVDCPPISKTKGRPKQKKMKKVGKSWGSERNIVDFAKRNKRRRIYSVYHMLRGHTLTKLFLL